MIIDPPQIEVGVVKIRLVIPLYKVSARSYVSAQKSGAQTVAPKRPAPKLWRPNVLLCPEFTAGVRLDNAEV